MYPPVQLLYGNNKKIVTASMIIFYIDFLDEVVCAISGLDNFQFFENILCTLRKKIRHKIRISEFAKSSF
jgi:hypothetical protein